MKLTAKYPGTLKKRRKDIEAGKWTTLLSLVHAARVNYTAKDGCITRGCCFYAGKPNPMSGGAWSRYPTGKYAEGLLVVGRKGKPEKWLLIDKS